jgi:hypothetical protein
LLLLAVLLGRIGTGETKCRSLRREEGSYGSIVVLGAIIGLKGGQQEDEIEYEHKRRKHESH